MKNLVMRNAGILVGCLVLFSACSPIFYAPNAHNVPLFQEKREARINAAMAITDDLSGPDVQLAYAVGKNVGIIANGMYLRSGNTSRWEGYGYLAEAGAGYFKPLGKRFVGEIYGGGGFSYAYNERQNSPFTTYETRFAKCFIQPNVGVVYKWLEVAVSPKIAFIRFAEPFVYQNQRTDAHGHLIFDSNGMPVIDTTTKQHFFALEPALTVRLGWKYVKLQLQVSGSVQDMPDSEKLNLNAGLCLNLASRFRESPPPSTLP